MQWLQQLTFFSYVAYATTYETLQTYPDSRNPWRVKAGMPTSLSCVSSKPLDLCQWGRPGLLSCGIFANTNTKVCSTVLNNDENNNQRTELSPWTVAKTDQGNNCSVFIESVGKTEEAEWHCQLDSGNEKVLLFPPSLIARWSY